MSNPKTLSEALCLIHTNPGVEYLTDPSRLLAVFSDVAPDLKAERAQLELLVKAGCVPKLSAALGLTAAEAKPLVDTAADTLSNVYLMDRKKAEVLCYTYVMALRGKTYTPAAKPADAAPVKSAGGTVPPITKPSGGKTPANKPAGATKAPAGKQVTVKGTKVTVTPANNTNQANNAPPSSGGCGISFILAIIAFVAVYAMSASGGYETPFLNGLFVAVGVFFLSFLFSGGKKKK